MTKDALLKKIQALSDEEFAKVSPQIEADLKIIHGIDDFHSEIREGMKSLESGPTLSTDQVMDRLSKKKK